MHMITKIEERIQNYNREIKSGEYPKPGERCPKCKEEVREYKLHDQRKKKFRIVVEALVQIITTILVRWKCSLCKRTFTVYPDFAVPYKQYALPHILELGENYLKKEEVSYEQAPKDGRSRISYPEEYSKQKAHEQGHESFLAPTTIRRWVCWLGSFKHALTNSLDMIKQKCPQTDIFRKLSPTFGRKYRSPIQKSILETALRVLQVRQEYDRVFTSKFFPHFAINQ